MLPTCQVISHEDRDNLLSNLVKEIEAWRVYVTHPISQQDVANLAFKLKHSQSWLPRREACAFWLPQLSEEHTGEIDLLRLESSISLPGEGKSWSESGRISSFPGREWRQSFQAKEVGCVQGEVLYGCSLVAHSRGLR